MSQKIVVLMKHRLLRPIPKWLGIGIRMVEIILFIAFFLWVMLSLFLWIHELILPGSVID